MKHLSFFVGFSLLFLTLNAQKKEIAPYVEFLETQQEGSIDYIFSLFEKYDIVILGERDHRDTTQYVLIEKILSDTRFINNVGNVFTEVGTCNRKDWVNKVLKDNYINHQRFESALRNVYRELDWEVIWEKYNYWMFLNSIYNINKNLPDSKKITLYPIDVEYDWSKTKTQQDRERIYARIYNGEIRDSIMAENFSQNYNRILSREGKQGKALVILNGRHAPQVNESKKRTAAYIFEKYPKQVANIMINWVDITKSGNEYLLGEGKWDASFRYLGNPSVGFDFANSPFGEDLFTITADLKEKIQYKDAFTGFIFYKPIEEWVNVIGIPNIIDDEFLPELKRRMFLNKDESDVESTANYYNSKRVVAVYSEELSQDSAEIYINNWLK